jgi:hypothetical protein
VQAGNYLCLFALKGSFLQGKCGKMNEPFLLDTLRDKLNSSKKTALNQGFEEVRNE